MVFRKRDEGEPQTIEMQCRNGETYWIVGVPAKKIEKIRGAIKWAQPVPLDFPVTEGGRVIFNYGAIDLLLINDAPVDAAVNVFHYDETEGEEEDEDE